MSIIEKAVDKLASSHQEDAAEAERSPQSAVSSSAAVPATTAEIDTGHPPAAVVSDSVSETVVSRPMEERSVEVDISFQSLGLEGILSPEGGRSRLDEEYRMIKRPILTQAFSQQNPAGSFSRLVMISSALSGEGKTFTSINLAISIAMEMDRTVLLIDADLAKPGLSRLLKINDRPGFTECLKDINLDLGDYMLHTDVPKLTVIPAGQRHNRATELLASNTMTARLKELANRYPDRLILFDSPPLLATSEASVLAGHMGQVAVVVEYGATPQFMLKEALSHLPDQDNLSLILNKTREDFLSRHIGGYGYGYGKGYGYGAYGER